MEGLGYARAFFSFGTNAEQVLRHAMRSGGVVECPACGGMRCLRVRRSYVRRCRCGADVRLRVGTVLEWSRTPVPVWLLAVWCVAHEPGITGVRLGELTGLRQPVASKILRLIRTAVKVADGLYGPEVVYRPTRKPERIVHPAWVLARSKEIPGQYGLDD